MIVIGISVGANFPERFLFKKFKHQLTIFKIKMLDVFIYLNLKLQPLEVKYQSPDEHSHSLTQSQARNGRFF